MFNLIIFNKNLNTIKSLTNKILGKIDNIKIAGIATDTTELYSLITEIQPDLLLISYSDLVSKSNDKIIFKKIHLIVYNHEKTYQKSKNNLFLSSNINYQLAIQYIQSFITKLDITMIRKRIIKLLSILNFNFKLIGTTYLLEALIYSYAHRDSYIFENLERNVYPEVAKICNSNTQNVKFSIIRAMNSLHLNKNTIKEISELSFLNTDEKPTAKHFISSLVPRL